MTVLTAVFSDAKLHDVPAKLVLSQPLARVLDMRTDKLLQQFSMKQVSFRVQNNAVYVASKGNVLFSLIANDMLHLYRALRNFNGVIQAKVNGNDMVVSIMPQTAILASSSDRLTLQLHEGLKISTTPGMVLIFHPALVIEMIFQDKATATTAFNLLKLARSQHVVKGGPRETPDLAARLRKKTTFRDFSDQVAQEDFIPKSGGIMLEPQSYIYKKGAAPPKLPAEEPKQGKPPKDVSMATATAESANAKQSASKTHSVNTSAISSSSRQKRKQSGNLNASGVEQSNRDVRLKELNDDSIIFDGKGKTTPAQEGEENRGFLADPTQELPGILAAPTVEHFTVPPSSFGEKAGNASSSNAAEEETKASTNLPEKPKDAKIEEIAQLTALPNSLMAQPTQQFVPLFVEDLEDAGKKSENRSPVQQQNVADNIEQEIVRPAASPAIPADPQPDGQDDIFAWLDGKNKAPDTGSVAQ